MVVVYDADKIDIREVWAANLEDEMKLIHEIVDDYPYIAMDTEFPGTVFQSDNINKLSYEAVKTNVNMTKLIQLGLTFSDSDGRLPTCGTKKHCIWQFNFREFDPEKDQHAESSINLLVTSGIDFKKNVKDGVDAIKFGELLMPSGAVLKDEMHWITFHGASDFGYLVKILTGNKLPETRALFDEKIAAFFPVRYDIKHLLSNTSLCGGLNAIAKSLDLKRVGTSHLAGSDSLLTNRVFLKLREKYFPAPGALENYAGVIFGIE